MRLLEEADVGPSGGPDVSRGSFGGGFMAHDEVAPHRLDHEDRHQRRGGVERDRDHEHRLPADNRLATMLASGTSSEAVPLAVYSMPLLVVAYLTPKVSPLVAGNRL